MYILLVQIQARSLSKKAQADITLERLQLIMDSVDVFLKVLALRKSLAANVARMSHHFFVNNLHVFPQNASGIESLGTNLALEGPEVEMNPHVLFPVSVVEGLVADLTGESFGSAVDVPHVMLKTLFAEHYLAANFALKRLCLFVDSRHVVLQ